jgi:peptidoglycan/LPS O-acetylase OafA/YrhL
MTRIDGLCIGCLIAVWKTMNEKKLKRRVLTLCGTVLIIHAAFFIILTLIGSDFPHFNILGYTSIAAVFGLFIFYGIWGRGKFKRIILENTVLKRLGEISYGLYVYHWPLLFMMKLYFVEQLTSIGLSANLSYITVCLLAAILAIGLSWLSFRFFEKPILGLKKRLL